MKTIVSTLVVVIVLLCGSLTAEEGPSPKQQKCLDRCEAQNLKCNQYCINGADDPGQCIETCLRRDNACLSRCEKVR
jgi:hypothetical protein